MPFDEDVGEAPLAVTSIPPVGDGPKGDARVMLLRRTIASFEASGFNVASVNLVGEVDSVAERFSGVRSVVDESPLRVFADRYGPSIGAVLAECRNGGTCAVINSDIYLARSNILEELRNTPEALFVSRRVDIEGWAGPPLGTYDRGIDALFFNAVAHGEMLDDRELGRLQIGAPFWDIAVPVVASFHRPIVFVRSPLIFHQVHEAQWSNEDYDRLRLVATNAILGHARRFRQSSLAARRFLHVAEGLIGTTASIRNRREAKLMARLVDAWLNRLEEAGSKAIAVDVSDPVLCAVAHAAGSDLQPFWMAESRWGRKTPPQGVLRNALRRWRKARERNRWDARLAEADWSVS